jgi:hypothetical protein
MIHTLQIMCRVRQKKAEAILADLLDDDGDIAAFFAGTVKEIEQDYIRSYRPQPHYNLPCTLYVARRQLLYCQSRHKPGGAGLWSPDD